MKTTYLVYKQVDGIRQLAVATKAEWHTTRTFPGKPGVMGRVIRTFITAGGYRGEGDLDVSAKVAHSGEGEAAGGTDTGSSPFARHSGSHGQTRAELLGVP